MRPEERHKLLVSYQQALSEALQPLTRLKDLAQRVGDQYTAGAAEIAASPIAFMFGEIEELLEKIEPSVNGNPLSIFGEGWID